MTDWTTHDLRSLARSGTVHFVGIGGAGMSALAEALVRAGGSVTGCDVNPHNARALFGKRIDVAAGHDPAHVENASAVVTTSAVRAEHPELVAARARGIPVLKRAQALGALVNSGTVLAIAGTHGKTTTTAMTTAILMEADLNPTAFVGGRVEAWGSGLRSGSETLFVVEADEYDRSFLTLQPQAVAVTSLEADHLDIYGSLDQIVAAFEQLLERVPQDGCIALCQDDAGARALCDAADRRVVRYGTVPGVDIGASRLEFSSRGSQFTLVENGAALGRVQLGVPGKHNVLNALAAWALARHAGASFTALSRALPSFHGVARRFQELGTARGITLVDDYAHHPTEIAATLEAARAAYAGQRLVAAFQPHLYSRTRDFRDAFGSALAAADVTYVTDIYAAREEPIDGVSGELLADAARAAGAREVHFCATLSDLRAALRTNLRSGDVCVGMGAGDIDQAMRELFAELREAA